MGEQNLGSKYVIGERLGAGAMGTVYRGRDHEGNEFAFKLLRSELAEEPELVQRFVQERSSLTVVDHPNVVSMHDLVIEGSTLAIVMDLVPGADLRQSLRQQRTLPPAEVARLGAGIASGLAAVHRAGIVHRDVKPENVLLDSSMDPPTPRVTDFGIARIADASAATRSSMMVGTPNYMAPEVAEGATPTPAVDVYGLGVILYELCCGVTPFEGGSYLAVIKRHADARPGRPDGVPEGLWDAIANMLAKDPAARPSAQQLVPYLTSLADELRGAPAAPALTVAPALAAMETERTSRQDTQQADVQHAGSTPAPGQERRRRSVLPILMGAGLAAAVAAAGIWWWTLREDDTAVADDGGDEVVASAPAEPTTDAADDTSSADATETDEAETDAPVTDTAASSPTTADETDEPEETTEEVPEVRTTPDVVGRTLSAARTELRGTRVTVEEEFDATAKDNEVLAQSVAAGEDLPDEIVLTVAKQPVTIYLDDMVPISGGYWRSSFSMGPVQVDGESYPRSLSSGSRTAASEGWNLSRGFRELQATLGRSDSTANTDTEVQLEIFLDRRKVYSEIVRFGEPMEMQVDVADALRLEIVATSLDERNMDIVLGDIRLLGLPGEVPELEE